MDKKEQISLMPADLPIEIRGFANWLQGAVPLNIYLQTIQKVIILLNGETKKAEVRGQVMAFNYALSKSQIFTYARSIGEIRAGEESGAVPIKALEDRLAALQESEGK